MSDADTETHAGIAAIGVTIKDRMIQRLCRRSKLSEAIFAVGQCAAMLTTQLVWVLIEVEEDRVYRDVAAALTLWKPCPADVRIDANVEIEGRNEKH